MTLATLLVAAAEEGEHSSAMLETIWFPIVAIAVFGLLALVTASYRNVSNRHSRKAELYARTHAAELERSGSGH